MNQTFVSASFNLGLTAVLVSGCAVLSSCAGYGVPVKSGLHAEIRLLAQRETCKRVALAQAKLTKDPNLADVGAANLDAHEVMCQANAYSLAVLDADRGMQVALSGMRSSNDYVRSVCLRAAARMPSNSDLDAAIVRLARSEPVFWVLGAAYDTIVCRSGDEGALLVHQLASERGPDWVEIAVPALSKRPQERFRDTFLVASSGAYGVWARRGLLALGGAEHEWEQMALQYGAEMSTKEYTDAAQALDEGGGRLREMNRAELVNRIGAADVVLVGENHLNVFIQSAEVELLGLAVVAWRGAPCKKLMIESDKMQGWMTRLAGQAGFVVGICEPVAQEPDGEAVLPELYAAEPRDRIWLLARRDHAIVQRLDEASRTCGKLLVVCGESHTGPIEVGLRQSGRNVLRVMLSSDSLHAAAIKCVDSLRIYNKLFVNEAGTVYLPARPYASWGCPELDDSIGDL